MESDTNSSKVKDVIELPKKRPRTLKCNCVPDCKCGCPYCDYGNNPSHEREEPDEPTYPWDVAKPKFACLSVNGINKITAQVCSVCEKYCIYTVRGKEQVCGSCYAKRHDGAIKMEDGDIDDEYLTDDYRINRVSRQVVKICNHCKSFPELSKKNYERHGCAMCLLLE